MKIHMFHKENWMDEFELCVGNNVEGNGPGIFEVTAP
jgi:hypothetical protein